MTHDTPAPSFAPSDLDSWLAARSDGPARSVAPALAGLGRASIRMADAMAQGPLSGSTATPLRERDVDGDRRSPLEAFAAGAILEALEGAGVAYLAAKDDDAILTHDRRGGLAIAIAHMGESADIAANVPTGMLFAIFAASPEGAAASFLRPGDDLLASGYVIHGAHTALVMTAREGIGAFVLDRSCGVFRVTGEGTRIGPNARDLAIDMSNYRYWHHPVRLLVDDCMSGSDGPRGVDYTFRGAGPLVAEVHRILTAGGVYIEPADHRDGRQSGGARLVFEAFAIALLMEQAGGAASDTHRRILSRTASDLRQQTPLVFGSTAGVKLVDDYHLGPAARLGEAPLFGRRGLYRK